MPGEVGARVPGTRTRPGVAEDVDRCQPGAPPPLVQDVVQFAKLEAPFLRIVTGACG